MKYAIMMYNRADEEQIFLGVKEMAEVRSTITKGIEEYVEEFDLDDFLGNTNLYIMAEDFNGSIRNINNKAYTLQDFFNSNKKACYFSLNDICLISKVTVEL